MIVRDDRDLGSGDTPPHASVALPQPGSPGHVIWAVERWPTRYRASQAPWFVATPRKSLPGGIAAQRICLKLVAALHLGEQVLLTFGQFGHRVCCFLLCHTVTVDGAEYLWFDTSAKQTPVELRLCVLWIQRA